MVLELPFAELIDDCAVFFAVAAAMFTRLDDFEVREPIVRLDVIPVVDVISGGEVDASVVDDHSVLGDVSISLCERVARSP